MHFVLSLATLQITICNVFYFDRCLPIGASSSCQIFERVSVTSQWLMQSKYNAGALSHILDDFFFIGPADSQSCKNDLTNFLYLCKTIGSQSRCLKFKPLPHQLFLWHWNWLLQNGSTSSCWKKLIRWENTFQTCNEKTEQIYASCNFWFGF